MACATAIITNYAVNDQFTIVATQVNLLAWKLIHQIMLLRESFTLLLNLSCFSMVSNVRLNNSIQNPSKGNEMSQN